MGVPEEEEEEEEEELFGGRKNDIRDVDSTADWSWSYWYIWYTGTWYTCTHWYLILTDST